MINVDWDDAVAYAAWLSAETDKDYRLPTEAEWEYVVRAGTKRPYWWCEEEESNCKIKPDVANCDGCESTQGLVGIGERTLPVGSFRENPFGLYDTAGNVWEWVEDCWHPRYKGAPENGDVWTESDGGDCGRRMRRGGSWLSEPRYLRSANRDSDDTGFRYYNLGFRLAQDL